MTEQERTIIATAMADQYRPVYVATTNLMWGLLTGALAIGFGAIVYTLLVLMEIV